MKTVNSVSGGKTSAYVMANYPADYNIFALKELKNGYVAQLVEHWTFNP